MATLITGPMARPTTGRTLAAVALCAVAYLYVFPYQARINNPNENVRLYMTAALAEEGTYVIDSMRERWGWVNDCAAREGHIYSVKAPATSFLGVPAYWAYHTWAQSRGEALDRDVALWLCRITASILPWLVFLWFFYGWIGRHTADPLARDAVFLSVALGSCLYGYGMLFMSHTLSAAAAFGAFMLLFDGAHGGRMSSGRAFLAGLLVASVTLLEYPGFVASLVLSAYALFALRPWLRVLPFAVGGLIPTAAMMHFQWRCFGSPFSPGHLYVETDALREAHHEGFFGAVGLQPEAFYGLLVHPGAGLFPLTPILAFGLVGLVWMLTQRVLRRDAATVLGVVVLTLCGIAVMNNWRGGWTIGPRYLALVYPFLGWAALFGLARVARRSPALSVALAVGTTLVGLVLSGAPSAYYPHYPVEIRRPISEVVAVLVAHDFAPFNALNLVDVYGTASMLPLALLGGLALGWLLSTLPSWRLRAVGLGAGALLAGALLAVLWVDPSPDEARVRDARALITRMWEPAGHDRAARMEVELREHPDVDGYRRLAELYEEEGRVQEANAARRRASVIGGS